MLDKRIENLNIRVEEKIISPQKLKQELPLTEKVVKTVMNGQQIIKNILTGKDKRLLVIIGPCSIHDIKAAKEYANRLKKLSDEVQDTLFLVMRVYFEKPRTTTGWQGLINDPYLDNSNCIEDGLKIARELLMYIAELRLAAAGEALDIVTPQYIQDLFSYTAIGARTTESQSHRKMASGFSTAVGFKNHTLGDIKIAVNAMRSASSPHNFVSVDPSGHAAVIRTKGNPYTNVILRGGKTPNYEESSVLNCELMLKAAGFKPNILIDCSHGNSQKNPHNQAKVADSVIRQLNNGNQSICGLMIESNLNEGKQEILSNIDEMKYGVSITDACIGWPETVSLLRKLHQKLNRVLQAG